jgi:hypothetical protein
LADRSDGTPCPLPSRLPRNAVELRDQDGRFYGGFVPGEDPELYLWHHRRGSCHRFRLSELALLAEQAYAEIRRLTVGNGPSCGPDQTETAHADRSGPRRPLS